MLSFEEFVKQQRAKVAELISEKDNYDRIGFLVVLKGRDILRKKPDLQIVTVVFNEESINDDSIEEEERQYFEIERIICESQITCESFQNLVKEITDNVKDYDVVMPDMLALFYGINDYTLNSMWKVIKSSYKDGDWSLSMESGVGFKIVFPL